MSDKKYIYVVSKSDTLETNELKEAAERLGIPLKVVRLESVAEAEEVVKDASVVYWRSGAIAEHFSNRIGRSTLLEKFAQTIPVINYGTAPVSKQVYKSVQQEIFTGAGAATKGVLPIPTFLAPDVESLNALLGDGSLKFPFIAKPNFGRCGVGILLIESKNDFSKLEALNSYVFQNYIKNTGDYRVLVIGGVAHMVFKRVATKDSTEQYLNNLSQGGERQSVTDTILYDKLAKAGSVIAALFGYTICGVDILEAEDGALYFLEVNSVPQWFGWQDTTKYSVAEHVLNTLVAVGTPKDPVTIFDDIERYYFENLKYLSPSTVFHFLSRLHLWSGKKKYFDEISKHREIWWATMPKVLQKLHDPSVVIGVPDGSKKYRREARQKHQHVALYNNFFFKCVFDRKIFSGTAFEDNIDKIDLERLMKVRQDLLNDPKSLFMLSTVAINFLYHFDHFLGNEDGLFDPKKLMLIPESQQIDNQTDDFDARIYFYTHMIIGASRFYSEAIPDHELPMYVEGLRKVEALISENYAKCTIDHKAEFMVCARLCRYESFLEPIIRSELSTSCSPHGTFLVNKHNVHNDRVFKQTLETAEHSNVLAIMAFGDTKPS